ncbi:hypothetical protein KVT40_004488 [Elsinoe batatas]|uniref:Gag1-like clamp domain-containing protein n=1 Tax=Elsinoe batatas TaxID=2601811 RepID=A0A8K0L168_9PEZI|nr:hypothetical protein KVT40_004488 [Elsinoe batatas]
MDRTSNMVEASREARRMLASKVKNDWDYPALPEWRTHTRHPLDPPESVLVVDEQSTDLDMPTSAWEDQNPASLNFEPLTWKERDYSSASSTEEASAADFADFDDDHSRRKHKSTFDTPDSVGDVIALRKENKKRKRAEELEQEMSWNTGLAHFIARRDAWTCARQPSQIPPLPAAALAEPRAFHRRSRLSISSRGASSRTSAESSTRSIASSHTPDLDAHASPSPSSPSKTPPPPTEPLPATLTIMIPIPPPLLPNHPIRAKIGTSAYSEIYSKIILQARTPTVPINLSHITKSLVRGWIEEGNWPPKQGVLEPLAGRKRDKRLLAGIGRNGERHPHLSKGVKVFGRVLGLGIGDSYKEKEKEKEAR